MKTQIIISLLILITVYISFQIYTIYYIKNSKKIKFGPPIGQKLNHFSIKDNGLNDLHLSSIQKKENILLLFVDSNCEHCKKLLSSTKFLNGESLKNVIFILTDNEENRVGIKNYKNTDKFYFIQETFAFDDLNIGAFPFYLELENDSTVKQKGYASNSTILDFLI